MLENTGERFLPWVEGAKINYEHLHRYAFAAEFVKGRRVLDLASGEGYGTHMLSRDAEQVVGVDIDPQSVEHATRRYSSDNVNFICGSMIDIPIEGQKIFDIIVCFEAIEHIKEHDELLCEVRRLLKEDGLFIVSTPNRATYFPDPQYPNKRCIPQHPFHVKELSIDELRNLLGNYFREARFLGQRVYTVSNLWGISVEECTYYKEYVIDKGEKEFYITGSDRKVATYYIALASDGDLEPHINNTCSSLVDVSDTLLREHGGQINALQASVDEKTAETQALQAGLDEKTAETQALQASVDEKTAETQALQASLDQKTAETQALQASLDQKTAETQALQASVEEQNALISALSGELAFIKQSLIWRATMRFQSFIARLLPLGTRRRYPYDLAITASHIIVNEGWRNFWFKAWRRLGLGAKG